MLCSTESTLLLLLSYNIAESMFKLNSLSTLPVPQRITMPGAALSPLKYSSPKVRDRLSNLRRQELTCRTDPPVTRCKGSAELAWISSKVTCFAFPNWNACSRILDTVRHFTAGEIFDWQSCSSCCCRKTRRRISSHQVIQGKAWRNRFVFLS